ncbi:MAG: hypothetical protein K2R93_13470 [Gemmatimonadaceae bacterium]|nr:hypothetical protein [Gemmatimonadaceae bacterium]
MPSSRFRLRIALAGLLVPALCTAQAARTFATDSLWRRVFSIGAEKESETFVEPRQIVVTSGLVAVLDLGTREVRGFDARTGRPRFVLKATGNGPGEFKRPSLLLPTPWGFAVVDQSTARLTGYRATGSMHWDIILPDLFRVSHACVRPDGRILVAYERSDSALVVLDTAGRRVSTFNADWRPARHATESFAHRAFLSAADGSGACALVRFFGADWALVRPDTRAVAMHPLIERGPEPVVKVVERVRERTLTQVIIEAPQTSESRPIARGIAIRGDTVLIFGSETARDAFRLVDYYDRLSGRYLYSRRLPLVLHAVTVGDDGTFYGTVIAENTQALVAFRPERLTKDLQRELDRARAPTPSVTPPTRDTVARRAPPASGRPRGRP